MTDPRTSQFFLQQNQKIKLWDEINIYLKKCVLVDEAHQEAELDINFPSYEATIRHIVGIKLHASELIKV